MNQDECRGLTNAQEWTSKGLNIMMTTFKPPKRLLMDQRRISRGKKSRKVKIIPIRSTQSENYF